MHSVVILYSSHPVRPYRCGVDRLVKNIHAQLTDTLCFHRNRVCFFSFQPNRFQLLHTHFISFCPHTYTLAGGVLMCVFARSTCVYVHMPYKPRFGSPYTTRLLIYRCLYMFALIFAVTYLFCGTRYALHCFAIFNTSNSTLEQHPSKRFFLLYNE